MARFFVCDHCGNLIGVIKDSRVPMICCGQKMTELVPNTVEASGEKHIPVVTVENGVLTVNVGSVDHPMIPEHFIGWVVLRTKNGSQMKYLTPNTPPHAEFLIEDGDEVVEVLEYCNLHGLWKG